MEERPEVTELLRHPERIGWGVGLTELTPMHEKWIQAMVCGIKDYTLQAHRGSFKSSCLATGCALLVGERGRNTGWPMGTAR